jgi:hypothetical protein
MPNRHAFKVSGWAERGAVSRGLKIAWQTDYISRKLSTVFLFYIMQCLPKKHPSQERNPEYSNDQNPLYA